MFIERARAFAAVASCSAALFALPAGVTRAVTPIPPEQRIEARVVRLLGAPADRPIHMPTDVSVDRRGLVFVADGVNDRVVCLTGDGRLESVLTAPGGRALIRPIGVTADAQDRLWIADTGNHCVLMIAADRKAVRTIDIPAPEGGRPSSPTDVAVTPDGNRAYIVDNSNHRILVMDIAKAQLTPAGRFGRALGQFQWPFMACVAPDGYAYVSEAIGARAQRISPTGPWAGELPPGAAWGVELGQLYRPKGIAADARSRVYIGDSTLGVVQVFGDRGDVLGVLTDSQGEPLRFKHPMGMCFDRDGFLYVVELGADRVAVVSLPDSSTSRAISPATRKTGDEP